jgi:TolA-binding protein
VPEFENVAMANTRIIMKMLKVYSNQMRRVHKQVSKLMAKEEESPADGLFSVGEYYLKNKRFTHAKHVFSRYLTYYPSGKNAVQAAKNLETVESSLSRYGDGKGPSVALSGPGSAAQVNRPAVSAEETSKAFKDASLYFTQGRYQEALMSFKAIADSGAGPEWTAKSTFEIGRCMFHLDRFDDSLRFLTNMLTQYPKHPRLTEAIFIMGQCNEKIGRKEQAIAFYKKILSMSSGEDATTDKAKRALSALGA